MSMQMEARTGTGPDSVHVQPKSELLISPEAITRHMIFVSQHTGIAAAEVMETFSFPNGSLDKAEKERRTKLADNAAARMMRRGYAMSPVYVESVGSEGIKELDEGIEVELVMGSMNGRDFSASDPNARWVIVDPIDNTKALTHRTDGAISVMAVSTVEGLWRIPDGVTHVWKLVGPPETRGKISIDLPPEENIAITAREFGVDPSRIRVVMLKRPEVNDDIAEAVRKTGAEVKYINEGDVLPGFEAVTQEVSENEGVVTLGMGRTGVEELLTVAAAAKAKGAEVQARVAMVTSSSPDLLERFPDVLRRDDLVPGPADKTMAIYTPITHDPWFDIPGIHLEPYTPQRLGSRIVVPQRGPLVHTVVLDSKPGVRVIRQFVDRLDRESHRGNGVIGPHFRVNL